MNWKKIPGFSRYEVSDCGLVRRVKSVGPWIPGPCSIWTSSSGYRMVDMTNDAGEYKSKSVHRLVMLAFVREPVPGEHVRHLDGDQTNNNLWNLRYGSQKENEADKAAHGRVYQGERHHKSVLNERIVREAREMLLSGMSSASVARHFGVSKDSIASLRRGETWRHVTGGRIALDALPKEPPAILKRQAA